MYLSYNPNSRSKSLQHYTRAKQMRKKKQYNQPIVRYSFVPSIGRFSWFETMTAGNTNSEFENVELISSVGFHFNNFIFVLGAGSWLFAKIIFISLRIAKRLINSMSTGNNTNKGQL